MHINVFKNHNNTHKNLAIKQYLSSKCSNVSNDPNREHICDER